MPDDMRIELSQHRMNRAWEMSGAAKALLKIEDYASANNRAYYAFFHAMRAVLALDGKDYKKHSAVIARFSEYYLKTDVFPRELGRNISNASLIRNRSDYEDFYICSKVETENLVADAEKFMTLVAAHLQKRYAEIRLG